MRSELINTNIYTMAVSEMTVGEVGSVSDTTGSRNMEDDVCQRYSVAVVMDVGG